ncbi:MAG TPA: glycerophosphodiester phosphodiesterase [Candidatus Dormibacteraeota bacterium]
MPRPLIDAHRGSPDGFEKAFRAGYDYVEFDVRRAPDGHLVIQHDPGPTDGALRFEELLEMASGSSSGLHVDLKEAGCETEIVSTLLARGFGPDRFVVTGADPGVDVVKRAFPEVRTGLSLGEDLEGVPSWRRVPVRLSELFPARRVRACRADFVAVDYRLAAYTVLRYCTRAGVPAWVWTVDDEAQIRRFLSDPRVAVLITNHPDRARALLNGMM